MEKRPFNSLGLSPEILKAVDKMGFEEASPIQTAVIPIALGGRDVVGQSATGSGKTAAFGIPAISKVDPHLKAVQALVLCPTRELAVQVAEEIGKLSLFKRGIHAVPIYGGQSYDRQFRGLAAGAQIVIGTPGRLMDHMERGTLKLDALRIVVLDEADRMLDMGFRDDIEHILSAVPAARQALFFSATMPRAIHDLINRYSRDPAWVKIEAHAQNAPQVDQIYFEVERRSKIDVLTRVIDLYDFRYGIIFCSTKIMVDELDDHLHARGYATDRLHGDMSQAQRDRVMDKFRRRAFEFLVATDVAARGLDLNDLEVVFNFDLPNDAEDYTHRIGRTGRAGKSGKAFTFVSGRELWKLQSMVRFAKLKIRRENVPSLDQVEEAKANLFFEKLSATLEQGDYRKHDRLIDRLLEQGHPSTDICSALIHLLQGGQQVSDGRTDAPSSPSPTRGGKGIPAADLGGSGPAKPKKTPKALTAVPASPRDARAVEPTRAPQRVESAAAPAKTASVPEEPFVQKSTTPAPVPAKSGVASEFSRSTAHHPYIEPARTGRDAGYATLFLNVGRKHLVTPADVVGKIAGVTRLPATVVGAIDIHQRHTLADVAEEHAAFIIQKLKGIRVKGQSLEPMLAKEGDFGGE